MPIPHIQNYHWSKFSIEMLINQEGVTRGVDASVARVRLLETFASCLTEALERGGSSNGAEDKEESYCCICYACDADAQFEPCHHISCFGCITRHLLNSQRCFFCNKAVVEVVRFDGKEG